MQAIIVVHLVTGHLYNLINLNEVTHGVIKILKLIKSFIDFRKIQHN